MSKPLVTIENWAVVKSGSYAAYQPLQPGSVLTGKVFGHARLPEARSIYTSQVVRVDLRDGLVETRNTRYRLGKVSEDYEQSEEYKGWENRRKAAA